jgi:hypothetical protein
MYVVLIRMCAVCCVGRSVLSKDQLAQRRGRDQGDDVLVSANDAGDLGIVSSNAGMLV